MTGPLGGGYMDLDREGYADWIWRGVTCFYNDDRHRDRTDCFEPYGVLMLQSESITIGVAEVYEAHVPESKKLAFRQAIGDVMRDRAHDEDVDVDAFRELIYLLTRVRAVEALDSLSPAIGSGLIGRRCPPLLFDTLAALRLLAPTRKAYSTALELVQSPNFDDGYLFDAVKVLVECEPKMAGAMVTNLFPRLNTVREGAARAGGAEWSAFQEASTDWARYLLRIGPTGWVNDLWKRLDHSAGQRWLFTLLFDNERLGLLENEESQEFYIQYGAKNVLLETSEKDRWTRRELLRASCFREFNGWLLDPEDIVNRTPVRAYEIGGGNRPSSTLGELILNRSVKWLGPTVTPFPSTPVAVSETER